MSCCLPLWRPAIAIVVVSLLTGEPSEPVQKDL